MKIPSRPPRTALTYQPRYVKPLAVPGISCFRAWYSLDPKPAFASRLILDNPSHVLHLATRRRLALRDMETLWWNVTSNTLSEKKVVRSWCSRRLRVAFAEALEVKGFDREGRAWARQNGSTVACLRGSLELLGTEDIVTAKFTEVQEQAGSIVDAIVKICSQNTSSLPRNDNFRRR